MTDVIIWLLVIEILGLVALPVAFSFLKFMPERGYSFAKIIGLLVAGFAVWFLGMVGLPFTAVTSWLISAIVLGGLSGWLLFRNGRKLLGEIGDFFRSHSLLVFGIELLFVVSFLFLVFIRSYSPEIRETEKPGDFAFMNSMVISDKLPPEDPWMSGNYINYYYFSHFMMAMLTKMSGIEPHFAYNLTVQLVFALTAVGAFGVAYNLIGLACRKTGGVAGLGGLLASFLICLSGNMDAVRQVLSAKPEGSFSFSYWSPSRVISDFMPFPVGNGFVEFRKTETINEFPYFSFILSDMHPHVMTLPFVLLVIMGAVNLLNAPVNSAVFSLRKVDGIFNFGLVALSLGALYFLNTWDFPTFFLFTVGAVLVREIRIGAEETLPSSVSGSTLWAVLLGGAVYNTVWQRFWRWFGYSVRLGLVSLALYLPFHLTFSSLVGNAYLPPGLDSIPIVSTLAKLILVVAWDRTPLLGYFLVFGVFALPVLSFLAIKLYPYIKSPYAYLDGEETPEHRPSRLGWFILAGGLAVTFSSLILYSAQVDSAFTLVMGILSTPIVGTGVFFTAKDFLGRIRPLRMANEVRLAFLLSWAILWAIGWYARFELYGLLIPMFVFAALLLWFENKKIIEEKSYATSDNIALMLIFLPALICFGIEIIFLRDVFNSRINTLFKFYYQTWVMYSLVAAYSTWRVIAFAWKRTPFEEAEAVTPSPLMGEGRGEGEKPKSAPSYAEQPVYAFAGSGGNLPPAEPPPVWRKVSSWDDRDYLPEDLNDEDLQDLEERGRESARKVLWWRWLWAFGLILTLLCGLVYPIFASYERTGRYAKMVGLDGMVHIQREYPSIYSAIQWMREKEQQDANFKGVILEAEGRDWADWSIFASFTGFPSVMGWSDHERQWRGGKEETLRQVDERVRAVEEIYGTTDVSRAKQLLEKYNVRYVIVGPFETGEISGGNRFGQPPKNYPREALAKFGSFLKVIYNQDGVTIYERVTNQLGI
jgi:YYY domain-containing protein